MTTFRLPMNDTAKQRRRYSKHHKAKATEKQGNPKQITAIAKANSCTTWQSGGEAGHGDTSLTDD